MLGNRGWDGPIYIFVNWRVGSPWRIFPILNIDGVFIGQLPFVSNALELINL